MIAKLQSYIYTLIFYTILNQLVGEVVIALNQPKEEIRDSFLESILLAQAIVRCEKSDTVTYLAERAKLFGLGKAERKRHPEKASLNQQFLEIVPLSSYQ